MARPVGRQFVSSDAIGDLGRFVGRFRRGWGSRQLDGALCQLRRSIPLAAGGQNRRERFRQVESDDCIVRNWEELDVFRKYIADNPHKAHLSSGRITAYQAEWI